MNTQLKGKETQIQNDNLQEYVVSTNEKTTITLEKGKNAATLKPNYLYPIMYKEILAGEYIEHWKINNLLRFITPLVPNFDRTIVNIRADFVPYTRIWKSAEKAIAGTKQENANLPKMIIPAGATTYSSFNRTLLSKLGVPNFAGDTEINLLPLRAYRAIENDLIRNKDYSVPKIEWDDDIPTQAEKDNVIIFDWVNNPYNVLVNAQHGSSYELARSQAMKGYLTNIHKQINVESLDMTEVEEWETIGVHLDWQTRFMDLKQRAENVNKNDWEIIAEMGGTQPVINDRVQHLGNVSYEMNFQQITQSAPEIDNSSPLGTAGSFSFTKAEGTLFSHKQFRQHGIIMITISVNIPNAYENGTPKELLKTTVNDIYRPGLAKKEIQLLMKQEISNTPQNTGSAAFQPAWAEYKRLPSWASGQMQSKPLTIENDTPDPDYAPVSNAHWHNMKPRETITITDYYFRNAEAASKVFLRNNILIPDIADRWQVEPFLNLSEHEVKAALPIENSVVKGVSKAEQTR